MENIAGEDFIPYLKTSLNEADIAEPEKLARDIFDFTAGHPCYTQLLAQQAVIHHGKIKPGSKRIKYLPEETLYVEKDYLDRLWENISGNRQQKVVMLALAEEKGTLYATLDNNKINISRTLKQLSDAGHITMSAPQPVLIDPLLRYWIRKNILKLDEVHH